MTQRTSEDLTRLLLPDKNDILGMSEGKSELPLPILMYLPASGSPSESAQGHGDVSICEEDPCDVVES